MQKSSNICQQKINDDGQAGGRAIHQLLILEIFLNPVAPKKTADLGILWDAAVCSSFNSVGFRMALDVVEFPEDIAWLDLSFNDITSISDDILEFPALKMIYLHGNKIRRFADIQKLQHLPNLYSLTLHGNPIENYPNYR